MDTSQEEALALAIKDGDIEKAKNVILSIKGIRRYCMFLPEECLVLNYASSEGHLNLVEMYLSKTAPSKACLKAAMRIGASYGHVEVVVRLLKHQNTGPSFEVLRAFASCDSLEGFQMIWEQMPKLSFEDILTAASQRGAVKIVRWLLSLKEMPEEAIDNALGDVCETRHPDMEIVEMLLQAGADPSAAGDASIHGALNQGDYKLVKLLVSHIKE